MIISLSFLPLFKMLRIWQVKNEGELRSAGVLRFGGAGVLRFGAAGVVGEKLLTDK
jgi:hypothetical protein